MDPPAAAGVVVPGPVETCARSADGRRGLGSIAGELTSHRTRGQLACEQRLAAGDLDRFQTRRLEVLEDQVLVVVLGLDRHDDLNPLAAGDIVAVTHADPVVHIAVQKRLPRHQLVVVAPDEDLVARRGDRLLEAEVGRTDGEIDRPLAVAADDTDLVVPVANEGGVDHEPARGSQGVGGFDRASGD